MRDWQIGYGLFMGKCSVCMCLGERNSLPFVCMKYDSVLFQV